ncbi:unnamed protein product [Gongylonema pulchrum]|uniref:C-mannosyltransferase DPY19L3 n=1 Tax=Gongylonema pulchrum TaxID=637853 RepID=A0A183EI97_9BILA|nr:unnamed protein product [Gongylonema pulchrum]
MDYEDSQAATATERIPLSSYQRAPGLQLDVHKFSSFVGFLVALLCGFIFAKYMQELHEVKLWFSHIKQVEQEISLRTEAGLYYSYFKMATQPEMSLRNTFVALLHDTSTEYPREINVLQRFNVYQELILATVYQILASYDWIRFFLPKPILFYVYSCFACAGFGITTLFLLSWMLNGSWIYGLLVFAWMTANLDDSTRAFFTVNLRENFALPFFWLQNMCTVAVLRSSSVALKKYYLIYFFSTFFFSLFWQFNQSIGLVATSMIMPQFASAVIPLLLLQSLAFFLVVLAQFAQPMAAASVCSVFNFSAIAVLSLTRKTKKNALVAVLCRFLFIFAVTAFASWAIRYVINVEADSHIWTFVKAKIGLLPK